MSRWRCIRCETFNESDRKKCIVCDLERKDETAKVKKKPIIINSCAFPGCVDKAEKDSNYCSKHKGKVCEMCKSDLKLLGEDYCASCMRIIIDNSTRNLKKWNKILSTILWLLLLVFVIVVIIRII